MVTEAIDAARNLGWTILLPDVAVMEMVKSPQWERTILASLHLLSGAPDLVSLAWDFGELTRSERDAGRPAEELVDPETTCAMRELLHEIAAGDENGRMRRVMRAKMVDAKQLAERQQLDHANNRHTAENLLAAIRAGIPASELRQMRDNEPAQIAFLSSALMIDTSVMALTGGGYSERTALRLTTEPSVSGHRVLGLASMALDWALVGGFETASPGRVTNDLVDLDYVILGTLGAELVSRDHNVCQRYAQLCRVADRRWERLRAVYEANGVPIWP